MALRRIAIALQLLFAHDLRANAFRVCREGKPLHTFPDHALANPPDEFCHDQDIDIGGVDVLHRDHGGRGG
jgi:hypothetical protein